MNLSGKKVGIWGYGIVGKATVAHLHAKGVHLGVCDDRILTKKELAVLRAKNIPFYAKSVLQSFLETYDIIMPSPGIDLRPYSQFSHKWLSEIDIFSSEWHKPIIGITGTNGKTTVTNLLSLIFKHANIAAAVGGNIGIGMLDLIEQQAEKKLALLELSSWQLEHCTHFAPSIALWTNFSENHLDRHGTMDEYFNAKYQILAHQTSSDTAIVPLALQKQIYERNPKNSVLFFDLNKTECTLRKSDSLLYLYKKNLYLMTSEGTDCIVQDMQMPDYSFTENWVAISAALYTLKLPLSLINQIDLRSYTQADRLELVCIKNGVSFYNDSKATTPAATRASVAKFVGKRIHLFLGGLSKGTDRRSLIQGIRSDIAHIYCFGKEADSIKAICDNEGIPAKAFSHLETAVQSCKKNCQSGDIVLLSPAGSSFDLFENYHERGNQFKKMVQQ